MASLFEFVARDHGVSVDQVRQSLSDRPRIFDSAVIPSYAWLSGLAACLITRKLCETFWRSGDRVRGVMMTVYVSAITSVVGAALAGLWPASMENIYGSATAT